MAKRPILKAQDATPRSECMVGVAAMRIAETLATRNVLAIVSSEYRARDIYEAMLGAEPKANVILFQPSDALPGDTQPPTPANTGARLAVLRKIRGWALTKTRARVACITTAEAVSEMLPKPATFDQPLTRYVRGGRLDSRAFQTVLPKIGYFEDDRVDEPAEFAMRGRVIDIFPANSTNPVRIELADGKIARLQEFDSVSQRGLRDLPFVDLGSAVWPAFLSTNATLFEYLPDATVAIDPGAAAERERFLSLAADATHGSHKRAPKTNRYLVSQAAWDAAMLKRRVVDLSANPHERSIRFAATTDPVRAMNAEIAAAMKAKARVVVAGSEQGIRYIKKRLGKKIAASAKTSPSWSEADAGWINRVKFLEMQLAQGWRDERRLVVSAADVAGSNAGLSASSDTGEHLLEIGDVCLGDVVIHEDHGIAVIAGLSRPTGAGAMSEAIELEYADGARRHIPVEEADRLWKYGADRTAVTLDGLGGASWRKRRLIIDRAMTETAEDITRLAQENAKRRAVKIAPDPSAYADFAAGFPFSETPDQTRAIQAVQEDLASGRQMDRLVVGDVGYGKTEVALRAAGLTALAGRQVAIAVPTTVLVRQHFETFKKRFERTGLEVASLSRLSDAAERRRVKAGLADGSISVVIGTGAVASKDVAYANLALVVIDEEQRFGTADKTALRDLTANGHLLSLTATPIPRTLQNALLGLKQISVIATPPARRQPIRTLAGTFDEFQVRTALLREKDRGGQSFVVVPRISDIAGIADMLQRLVPELSCLRAHGEMPAAAIDEAMVRFASGNGDVLLATNIIEAGLDVPRANTMIVLRSDRFGLAQLHQLRGRVGRGNRRGHILLTTEPGASLTEATRKRLRTLESLDRLGAGFAISARDLDIRGAGDLVGDAQSGHMKLIGIDLYQHLLERAVRESRGEKIERWMPVINAGFGGRIPPDWIPEADTRLSLYLRLARLTSRDELRAFEEELVDRFGEEPDEVAVLLRIAKIRTLARDADIAKVDAGPSAIAFTPRSDPTQRSVAAAGLVSKAGRLLLEEAIERPADRLTRTEDVLRQLARKPKRN